MPRIAIIKPACYVLLIPFSISAVPQRSGARRRRVRPALVRNSHAEPVIP